MCTEMNCFLENIPSRESLVVECEIFPLKFAKALGFDIELYTK